MPAPRPRHARATPAPLSCDPWTKKCAPLPTGSCGTHGPCDSRKDNMY
eukprot:gene13262-biopygen6499